MGDFVAPKLETIKAAFIGVGARGPGHLKFFASLPGTEVVALCDLYQDLTQKWSKEAEKIGNGVRHKKVAQYYGDENQWRKMLDEVKPDVVFISTNWNNHAPMAIEAMKKGAHAFVEVPIAVTLEEMWEIVNTSEQTQKHCMMMENVNYSRDELMFLNMCRQGVIGRTLACRGCLYSRTSIPDGRARTGNRFLEDPSLRQPKWESIPYPWPRPCSPIHEFSP